MDNMNPKIFLVFFLSILKIKYKYCIKKTQKHNFALVFEKVAIKKTSEKHHYILHGAGFKYQLIKITLVQHLFHPPVWNK